MPRAHRYVAEGGRSAGTARKSQYLDRIYDIDQYSGAASEASGCQVCKYLAECKRNLWAVRADQGDGLLYVPLRCFAEHPLYNKAEWKARQVVQEVMEL